MYGLAKITPTNNMFIKSFLKCMEEAHKIEMGYMLKITCSPALTSKKSTTSCQTFYTFRNTNEYECQKICWNVKNYAIICNQQPKSNFNRNILITFSLVFTAIASIMIWRNRKDIRVSCIIIQFKDNNHFRDKNIIVC